MESQVSDGEKWSASHSAGTALRNCLLIDESIRKKQSIRKIPRVWDLAGGRGLRNDPAETDLAVRRNICELCLDTVSWRCLFTHHPVKGILDTGVDLMDLKVEIVCLRLVLKIVAEITAKKIDSKSALEHSQP